MEKNVVMWKIPMVTKRKYSCIERIKVASAGTNQQQVSFTNGINIYLVFKGVGLKTMSIFKIVLH